MRVRSVIAALVTLTVGGAFVRPAFAQEIQFFPSSTPSDFRLTNQPLFIGDVQSTAAQRTQRDPEQGFGFGIKVGPLFSTFNQEGVTFENKTGFLGGIWFGGNRPGLIGVMGE